MLGVSIRRKRTGLSQTSRAKRPLHRAYTLLSILFALAIWALVFVGVLQASPTATQYVIGWFFDTGQTGTAIQQLQSDSPVQAASSPDQIGFERQLFAVVNKARIDRGLSPLKMNDALTRAARAQAKFMSSSQRVNVVDEAGKLPPQRAQGYGYTPPQTFHELISAGFSKPDQVLAGLAANPNSARILFGNDVNEIGLGYAYARDDRAYQHYWTIDLGRRGGTSFTVVVNNGAESTTSAQVTLRIGGKEWAQQMLVSNARNFAGANWEPYAENKTWTLSEGTGPKKVYVRLRGAGNVQADAVAEVALMAATKGVKPGPPHQDVFAAPRAPNLRRPVGDIAVSGTTASGATTGLSVAAVADSLMPGYYQTSEFMLGKVAVGVVIPQCTGAIDHCTETWNAGMMDQVVDQVTRGLNWWSSRMNGRVTFVLDQRRQVSTGYEPINHPQSDEGLWIADVMTNLGFNGPSYFEQVYTYNNWLRQKYGADWAFTVLVANSANNQTGTFSNGYFGYSYVPGPFTVITYDNDGYGINNMQAVVAHETGHIFGALDQYAGAGVACTDISGYLGVQNQNSQLACALNQDSIMRGGLAPYYAGLVDPYAMGQLGNRSSSGGDLPDPINTRPVVTLNLVTSPTNNTNPTITGAAQDQPYAPPSGDTISIDYISSVQYRVDNGAWQNAMPDDGSPTFNKLAQGFTFTPALAPGAHSIDVRALNRFNTTSNIATTSITVQGSGVVPTPTAMPPTPAPILPSPTPILPSPTLLRPPTVVLPTRIPRVTPTPVPSTVAPTPTTVLPTIAPTPTAVPPTLVPTPTAVPPTVAPTPTTIAPGGTTIAIQINAGTNALSLPYTAYTASSLIAAINAQGGSVTEVQQWSGRAWVSFKPGTGAQDFSIDGGVGYVVKANAASTWNAPLRAGAPAAGVNLEKGWDTLGVLPCKDGSPSCYTASSLAAAINASGGGVAEIDRWVNGSWSAYMVGYTFNDFPIVLGQGYFVRSTKPASWRP